MRLDHAQRQRTSSLFEPLLGDVEYTSNQESVNALRALTLHCLALSSEQVACSQILISSIYSHVISGLSD